MTNKDQFKTSPGVGVKIFQKKPPVSRGGGTHKKVHIKISKLPQKCFYLGLEKSQNAKLHKFYGSTNSSEDIC